VSTAYFYICTKTTADPYIPPRAISLDTLSRDVSDAFSALSGGRIEVGQIAIYPVQRSVPNHLLCDGREVSQISFPELYAYLGDSQGTAAAGNFKLPDFLSGFSAAATADTETVTDGTVTTPAPTTPPPAYDPDSNVWGDADSGGRPQRGGAIP
jgi:hypothetical protein